MINEDALRSIEKLHEMKAAGILSEEEFAAAKQDLLQGRAKRSVGSTVKFPASDLSLDDHLQWMLLPLRRYAQFEGRSGRREFWMFMLMLTLAYAALLFIAMLGSVGMGLALVLAVVVSLGTIIPAIAVQARRFHDQGKSGWFVLFNLVPYIGGIVALIFMALPGTEGENQYGPDPRL